MIKYVIIGGIIVIGITAFSLATALILQRIRRYAAKRRYQKLIQEKMKILAELEEELEQKENDKVKPTKVISETSLPADFFDTNYLEVKP